MINDVKDFDIYIYISNTSYTYIKAVKNTF